MKKTLYFLLIIITALSLTGCGYKKPEKYSVLHQSVDSITTICKTDCIMDDVKVSSSESSCTAVYCYTEVADGKGISDAEKYYNYLKGHSRRIDKYDEKAGEYTAYIGEEKDKYGFSIKVAYTKDTYTISITDNVEL